MLELFKKIEGSFITNVVGGISYAHTINAELQNGDYIDIYGLNGFLQDLSTTEETAAIVIPSSFGYKNQFYPTIVDLDVSIDGNETSYQERIYVQNEFNGVRNRNINLFNTSSDICIFTNPKFSVIGAGKINCTGSTTGITYVVSADTQTIPLSFNFTANTNSFSANNATFRYEIYENSNLFSGFSSTPVYKSITYQYSGFSGTNIISESIAVSGLSLDGDYLIKGYYDFQICTDYLGKLNKNINTYNYLNGNEFGIYNKDTDYYFIAFREPEKPIFTNQNFGNLPSNKLSQVILPINTYSFSKDNPKPTALTADTRIVTLPSLYTGDPIITFNGLVLAKDLDYTLSGTVVTLNEDMVSGDVVTAIFTTSNANPLTTDVIVVDVAITSGATDGQGLNSVYYNTTTNKYELFTSVTPSNFNSALVMINGVTLANGLDYYQSISNPRRIILVGDLVIGDIITIVYFPSASVSNNIFISNPVVTWSITRPPKTNNGYFTLELASDYNFNSIIYTATTDYAVDTYFYGSTLNLSGDVNTKYYYRVRNDKNYTNICGNVINSHVYSDIIPITIASNSINSY